MEQKIINNIKNVFKGFNFPAKKTDIVNHAESKGVGEDIINRLKQLPEQTFNSIQDVLSKLSLNDAEEEAGKFFDDE